MIKIKETRVDRNRLHDGFITYSVAKREGIKSGSMFEIAEHPGCFFQAGEYIDWRNDTNCEFKGFTFDEL